MKLSRSEWCCFPAVAGVLLLASTGLAQVTVVVGDDWSLPAWVEPEPDTGFFSEEAAPAFDVGMRAVDVSWRQLNPALGVYSTTGTGSAQGMSFASLDDQLASGEPFWLRIWASGEDWAPAWVVSDCGITDSWVDYDGQYHLPIWNACLWNHLMTLYRKVFIDWDLRSDSRLRLVYVPGAFTWCEFDFDIIDQAAGDGLSHATFDAWFQQAMADMVLILNGDNADPGDDYAYKLVYTGEDYPWSRWDELDDYFALDAVNAGLGIRTGITELFNFHLSHIPSYGITIAGGGEMAGHMVVDESWPLRDGKRVIATENECYTACGYSTPYVYYAVKMSNLKALQMRVNWLYVYPGDSYMAQYPELWAWVRASLGQDAATSADAWVALREAEDRYWIDDDSYTWDGKPWVRNYERWLVQRDIDPDGRSRRGTDVKSGVLDPDNGTAYEGRRTHRAAGQDYLYLWVDDAFLAGPAPPFELKVSFVDTGTVSWYVEYQGSGGGMTATPAVTNTGSGLVKTATFSINDAVLSGALTGGADLRIYNGGVGDIEVRFVRLIKLEQPQIFSDGFESGDTTAWSSVVP